MGRNVGDHSPPPAAPLYQRSVPQHGGSHRGCPHLDRMPKPSYHMCSLAALEVVQFKSRKPTRVEMRTLLSNVVPRATILEGQFSGDAKSTLFGKGCSRLTLRDGPARLNPIVISARPQRVAYARLGGQDHGYGSVGKSGRESLILEPVGYWHFGTWRYKVSERRSPGSPRTGGRRYASAG